MSDVESYSESDPGSVVLSGVIGIGAIADSHAQLVEALARHDHVVASVDPAASIDLLGVQLIESARRTALAAGGTFVLAEPATGDFHETLRRGGFLDAAEHRAFWLNAPGDL
jgi:hypothetical protein